MLAVTWDCREALQEEAVVIAALAKIEPDHLNFSSEKLEQQSGKSDQIQVVVAEGLEVQVPMAGILFEFVWLIDSNTLAAVVLARRAGWQK